jgi:hypothetical protein
LRRTAVDPGRSGNVFCRITQPPFSTGNRERLSPPPFQSLTLDRELISRRERLETLPDSACHWVRTRRVKTTYTFAPLEIDPVAPARLALASARRKSSLTDRAHPRNCTGRL